MCSAHRLVRERPSRAILAWMRGWLKASGLGVSPRLSRPGGQVPVTPSTAGPPAVFVLGEGGANTQTVVLHAAFFKGLFSRRSNCSRCYAREQTSSTDRDATECAAGENAGPCTSASMHFERPGVCTTGPTRTHTSRQDTDTDKTQTQTHEPWKLRVERARRPAHPAGRRRSTPRRRARLPRASLPPGTARPRPSSPGGGNTERHCYQERACWRRSARDPGAERGNVVSGGGRRARQAAAAPWRELSPVGRFEPRLRLCRRGRRGGIWQATQHSHSGTRASLESRP